MSTTDTANANSKQIVLVDDNRYVHLQFNRLLADMSEDIELFAYHCAEDSRQFLDEHKPAMLFLDALMPDRDGFTHLSNLRKNPLQQSTFVVMMASTDYAQNRYLANELSVVEFLIKPIPTKQIISTIKRYIDRDNPY